MPNILEQISGLCDSGYTSDPRTNQQLYSIKKIAGRNPVLSVIACLQQLRISTLLGLEAMVDER